MGVICKTDLFQRLFALSHFFQAEQLHVSLAFGFAPDEIVDLAEVARINQTHLRVRRTAVKKEKKSVQQSTSIQPSQFLDETHTHTNTHTHSHTGTHSNRCWPLKAKKTNDTRCKGKKKSSRTSVCSYENEGAAVPVLSFNARTDFDEFLPQFTALLDGRDLQPHLRSLDRHQRSLFDHSNDFERLVVACWKHEKIPTNKRKYMTRLWHLFRLVSFLSSFILLETFRLFQLSADFTGFPQSLWNASQPVSRFLPNSTVPYQFR